MLNKFFWLCALLICLNIVQICFAENNKVIVRAGNNCILDGFVISGAAESGVDGNGVNFELENCTVTDNQIGINAVDGNVSLKWCDIKQNRDYAVRHEGEGFTLQVDNCSVRKNQRVGLFCQDSTLICRNSIISEADLSDTGNAGVTLFNAWETPYLQNLTVSFNRSAGVAVAGSTLPNVQNCIIFHNGGPALLGFSAEESAWYSCIEDANSISERHVINTDPKFAYFDPNNVRLSPESIGLLGASNPALMATYMHQRDMDGQPRVTVLGTPPDMGAYQLACDTNVSSPWDTNADGVVNLLDGWDEFARAWGSVDPLCPEWLEDPNIADPNLSEGWYEWKYRYNYVQTGYSAYTIDLEDFLYWVDEAPYLWCACWYQADSCGDEHSIYDFDRDGLVNLYEFSLLSSVWGTYQPENPVWQFCNFVQDETIDLADMIVFLDNWLWVSCTRQSEFPQPEPMPAPLPPAEPTVLEQAIELQSTICMLETVQNEPNFLEQIDPADWQDFMDAVYQEMDTLTSQLSEMELLVLELLAPDCGTEQMAMSGGDLFTMYSMESEPVETDLTYTEMPTGELASLATGIYSILNEAETALAQGGENPEEWLEIRDFMLTILADIRASRQ
jgi:hypothetical protein